jgi:hypothetical protein
LLQLFELQQFEWRVARKFCQSYISGFIVSETIHNSCFEGSICIHGALFVVNGNLTGLRSRVAGNKLSGKIPPFIAKWTNLTDL